jgi:hypothetical protein
MNASLALIRETLLSMPTRKVGSPQKSARRAANKRARIARRINRR